MAREFTDPFPPCQRGFVYGRMTRIYETSGSAPPRGEYWLSARLVPILQ